MQYEVDATRLLCPMPVIRLSDALKKINIGDTIKITATDRGALHDIPTWCRVHEHKVLKTEQKENIITFFVEKIV